jgi:hypothetical protein
MICELTEKGNGPRKGMDREREGTGSRARKASTGSRPSTESALRARKAASRLSSGSRARKAASRPSTNGGIKGGGGVEAEHQVEGEEGGVEVSDGVEVGKRWHRRHRGRC